jgi:hypothetical protein
MITAIASDFVRHRFLFAIGCACVALAGFVILMRVHSNTNAEYAALFLVVSGTYSALPIIVCWFNMNLGGHHRRAVSLAPVTAVSNTLHYLATSVCCTDMQLQRPLAEQTTTDIHVPLNRLQQHGKSALATWAALSQPTPSSRPMRPTTTPAIRFHSPLSVLHY